MSSAKIPVIRAVVFDFDGTLTRPGPLDFARIREKLNCPSDRPVLEFISSLDEQNAERCRKLLEEFEYRAAEISEPNRGAEQLLEYLNVHGIPFGIVSRNSLRSILRALENFQEITPRHFRTLITRDDQIAPKPDPASILEAADRLGVHVDELLTVGDFVYDVEAGRRSGALTVYLKNDASHSAFKDPPDYVVEDLEELQNLIDRLRPLPIGKLPNRFLEESLAEIIQTDEQLLTGAGVGEDAAAVQLTSGDEVLVLKSDPITFATDRLAYYAIVINANDVAATGATPRWLLTTLLLPPESNAAGAQRIIAEINQFCVRYGIQLCGGHTEITGAVTQPVIVAQLIGTCGRSNLLEKDLVSYGDRILLTKGLAIEGTATIAHEFADEMLSLGLSEADLEAAQQLLYDPGISVITEARAVRRIEGVTAMHDVTEGGLATALEEFSAATNRKMVVDHSQIHILPETTRICERLGLDPMGLLASGSLLIACSAAACPDVFGKLESEGIRVQILGHFLENGRGVRLSQTGMSWPTFETDEISRAFKILSAVRRSAAHHRQHDSGH